MGLPPIDPQRNRGECRRSYHCHAGVARPGHHDHAPLLVRTRRPDAAAQLPLDCRATHRPYDLQELARHAFQLAGANRRMTAQTFELALEQALYRIASTIVEPQSA